MNLTLAGIKETNAWEKHGIRLPKYDVEAMISKTKANPTWVHFGAGNIFRIFLGGVAEDLLEAGFMETGITCVETFDEQIIDDIYAPFDNLVLSILLKADGQTDKRVLASLAEGIKADKARLAEIFRNPSLQMASFTITEKGYALKDANGDFFPWISGEVAGGPAAAMSAMGIATASIYERYLAGGYPVAMVSMDNCAHNGAILKGAVTTMAEQWLALGFVEAGFLDYLNDESKVTFPWSMIDKITPRPAESIAAELAELGIADMAPVTTEKRTFIAPFVNAEVPQYLVVEDKFPNGRPAFEKIGAGVYLTDQETVNKVEQMKVTTCLNPLHTALAVYGCVLGYTLIADQMKDEQLKNLVLQIGPVEGMPVVTDPGILSPDEFVDEVINVRLPNPFMPDAPQRIATDTSQKVGIRFGETIKAYVAKDGDAKKLQAIPLALAGWCRYLLAVDDDAQPFELSDDPMLAELTALVAGIKVGEPASYTGQLKPLLSNANVFGVDLYEAGLGELVEAMFVELIAGPGAVRATLVKYVG
ncbi:MAG: mannitol dehydrogenase family protein [Turicibacter sp.]|nr:mannitol dehydrogenase family protein [Turicibacter sp.]